jgi:hypothetical protein
MKVAMKPVVTPAKPLVTLVIVRNLCYQPAMLINESHQTAQRPKKWRQERHHDPEA